MRTNYLLIEAMMKSENRNEREPRTGVSECQGNAGVRTDKSENQNFSKPVISPVMDFEGKRVVRTYEKKL